MSLQIVQFTNAGYVESIVNSIYENVHQTMKTMTTVKNIPP